MNSMRGVKRLPPVKTKQIAAVGGDAVTFAGNCDISAIVTADSIRNRSKFPLPNVPAFIAGFRIAATGEGGHVSLNRPRVGIGKPLQIAS